MSSVQIKPTLSVPIFGGEITVHGFGRDWEADFSFRGIDDSENAHGTHSQIFSALSSINASMDYFAPSPVKMNAELVVPDQLANSKTSRCWKISNHIQSALYRGQEADGLIGVNQHTGYVMSAADCAVIVAKNGNLIIAAHAGRNSVIDMTAMKGGEQRKNESVVHAIRNAISLTGANFRHTEVWVGFSISPGPHFPHAFDDARNPHNRRMVEEIVEKYGHECFKDDGEKLSQGWLDNKELIRRQFISLGVRESSIKLDSMCTHSDMRDGEYLWHSNVRSGTKRNLIAVVKNR